MSELLQQYPVSASRTNKLLWSKGLLSRFGFRRATKQALAQTSAPLLEVGGHNPDGYLAIDGMKLPNGLIISNHVNDKYASLSTDVRQLSFAPRSLGGILVNDMARTTGIRGQTQPGNHNSRSVKPPYLKSADDQLFDMNVFARIDDHSSWNDREIVNNNLPVALLREARRTIQPNGVLITSNLRTGEIELAQDLGFTVLGFSQRQMGFRTDVYSSGEVLFALTNLETPAGLLVEQNPIVDSRQIIN